VLSAFALAFAQLTDRAFRRPLVIGLLAAVAIFAALLGLVWWVLTHTHFLDIGWLETAIDALGGIAALVLTFVLYPAVVAAVTSLFLDSAIDAVEHRHYPGLSPPRPVGIGEQVWAALRLLIVAVFLNLLVLPLYLLPAINLVVFYALNGYILGREYLETVALRRRDGAAVRRLWSDHRMRWVASGALIALFSTIPVVNLVAPLVGAAALTHQVARVDAARMQRSGKE
jgi:CysZ protein